MEPGISKVIVKFSPMKGSTGGALPQCGLNLLTLVLVVLMSSTDSVFSVGGALIVSLNSVS